MIRSTIQIHLPKIWNPRRNNTYLNVSDRIQDRWLMHKSCRKLRMPPILKWITLYRKISIVSNKSSLNPYSLETKTNHQPMPIVSLREIQTNSGTPPIKVWTVICMNSLNLLWWSIWSKRNSWMSEQVKNRNVSHTILFRSKINLVDDV